MSNTSKGKGKKGSKFWMQMVINTKYRLQLNESIGDNIQWLSPLVNQDDYAEYELKHQYISDITGIKKEKFSFWPGIAISFILSLIVKLDKFYTSNKKFVRQRTKILINITASK